MFNRQNKTLNLLDYFTCPASPRQKQYEIIRAIIIDKEDIKDVSNKFGYAISTIYSLLRDAKAKRIELFPTINKGPQKKRFSTELRDKIISLRKTNLSSSDIQTELAKEKINISSRTVERILKEGGFKKLKRRKYQELGKTLRNTIIPERADNLDFSELTPFSLDCPSIGVFFFIPYIIESKIIEIVKKCRLPESSDIGSTQACLSMLLLKLLGGKRLSHIRAYDQEPGFGIFAGLNFLPKPSYMGTYSCRCSEIELMNLQNKIIASFRKQYPDFYRGKYINLDFHTIAHFGGESEMEKLWSGAKNKSVKGANTVFAQDSQSNAILYTRADILRKDEAMEVKRFVNYWKEVKGDLNETLVFDCKFTTYKILEELENEKVKFITLRKRNANLIKKILEVNKDKWRKLNIPIPKRKYKYVSVYESEVTLKKCQSKFRQIVIKDHGRNNPTFILTNNRELLLKDILEVYARRWRIENKLSELVSFFNLNALSSPIMIRIHFDILWTLIADTLYHRFAQDLRRFERILAPTIFKKFVDMPGRIIYDGDKFIIKIRKRSHTPVLRGVKKLISPFNVPWLNNKFIEIIWTA